MTRRTIVFKEGGKFYASQEFNGDKAEAGQFCKHSNLKADWPDIVALFDDVKTVEDFGLAVRKAEDLYGYEHEELEQVNELPGAQEVWLMAGGYLHLHFKYGEPVANWVKDLAEEYGFRSKSSGGTATVTSRNTDGQWTTWFSVTVQEDGLCRIRGNNTDQCNIWLYETRPDMTPERCMEFFEALNSTLGLFGDDKIKMSTWIDPEDWQAIAGVCDAYEDERYTGKKEEK